MPLYEYRCDACGRTFEELRASSQADEAIELPRVRLAADGAEALELRLRRRLLRRSEGRLLLRYPLHVSVVIPGARRAPSATAPARQSLPTPSQSANAKGASR